MSLKLMTSLLNFLLIVLIAGVYLMISSCKYDAVKEQGTNTKPVSELIATTDLSEKKQPIKKDSLPKDLSYAFNPNENALRLTDLIAPPEKYERLRVENNSFAEWLRFLPVKPEASPVRLFNGELKPNQNIHAAVVDIDVGKRDLQQCADAVMRLKSEYHYSRKEYARIHFNFTSGHKVAFDDWAKGRKPRISGNNVTFSSPAGAADYSYSNFKKYMIQIFSYAGTASLSKELDAVDLDQMRIGDVFIQGGFPGHAVLVMDMAENEQGEKLFLLAQSYMPAQDIHILKNFNEPDISPWYRLDFENNLLTPEWTFDRNDLKRF